MRKKSAPRTYDIPTLVDFWEVLAKGSTVQDKELILISAMKKGRVRSCDVRKVCDEMKKEAARRGLSLL